MLGSVIWIINGDYNAIPYVFREVLFVFTLLVIISSKHIYNLKRLEKYTTYLLFIILIFYVSKKFSLIFIEPDYKGLFYGNEFAFRGVFYDKTRPSAQIPISLGLGYLLFMDKKITKGSIYKIILIIFTTSRSTILGIIPKFSMIKNKILKGFILTMLFTVVIAKFSLQNNDLMKIDGSALRRFEIYSRITKIDAKGFILGYGSSDIELLKNSGLAFYESYFLNTFLDLDC